MKKETGVSVGTQPLSIIMEEKMRDKTFPTAVVTMCGQIKQSMEDKGDAELSTPMEGLLQGENPIDWSSRKLVQSSWTRSSSETSEEQPSYYDLD